jgi:hypothetical protein
MLVGGCGSSTITKFVMLQFSRSLHLIYSYDIFYGSKISIFFSVED